MDRYEPRTGPRPAKHVGPGPSRGCPIRVSAIVHALLVDAADAQDRSIRSIADEAITAHLAHLPAVCNVAQVMNVGKIRSADSGGGG